MSKVLLKVPFNDTSRLFVTHKDEILKNIQMVGSSGYWLNGEFSRMFSENFAQFVGADYCRLVGNGTDALELALRSIIGHSLADDNFEVITVANAGGYATTACRLVGVSPVYADVNENNLLLDLNSLENCLNENVKAIVVTHLYGGVVDIPKIRDVLKKKNYSHIPIVEDCAQAHGGKISERRVGSMGDIATFSFYPTKNLGAMGDGGAITTSRPDLFERVNKLHQYGWGSKYQVDVAFGRNSRMDEIQASVLSCILPRLEYYNARRRAIYQKYREAAGHGIQFLDYQKSDYVGHLVVAKIQNRQKFMHYMTSKGIAVDVHYPVLDCDQHAWKGMKMRMDEKSCLQVSRQAVSEIVSLPCFALMTEQEVDYVCEALTDWKVN